MPAWPTMGSPDSRVQRVLVRDLIDFVTRISYNNAQFQNCVGRDTAAGRPPTRHARKRRHRPTCVSRRHGSLMAYAGYLSVDAAQRAARQVGVRPRPPVFFLLLTVEMGSKARLKAGSWASAQHGSPADDQSPERALDQGPAIALNTGSSFAVSAAPK